VRVLLIDPDREQAEQLRRALDQAAVEFEITHASTLPAGLRLARADDFDVALLGLPCPTKAGAEPVRLISETAPQLPVVAMVASEAGPLREQAITLGAYDSLARRGPDLSAVVSALRKAAEMGRLERERSALELEAADRRAQLEAILHAGSVGVAFTSLTGQFEEVNGVLETLLGATADELLSTSVWKVMESEPGDRDRVRELIEGGSAACEFEREFRRSDGGTAIVKVTVSLIRDREQRPRRLAMTFRDMSDRRRTEEELRRNLDESRAILETANDAFITMAAGGEILEWNRRAEQMFGWPRAEALGRTVAETIVPPALRERHSAALERFNRSGESRVVGRPLEMSALRRDGTEFPAELTIWPSGTADSPRFNAFIRDLSERAQATKALSVSEMRFRALFDQSPMGIAVLDAEQRIVTSNSGLDRMLGYEARELQGRSYAELAHPDDRASARDFRTELLSGQHTSIQVERRYLRKDGESVWLRVSTSRMRDASVEGEFFIAMGEDITDQKRAEETMREMTLQLLDLIGKAASEAATFEEALRVALEQVCVHVGWQVGHVVWASEDGSGDSSPSTLWYLTDTERFDEFRRCTMAIQFASGEGLPGRVIASRKPLWTSDLAHDPLLLRGAAAQRAQIRAAFGFPVMVGEEVKAVMEFFSTETVKRDQTLIHAMSQIGLKLGRVMERKRLEALLEHQALHDPLTGLPNRALFLDRLKHALTRLERNVERLGLLFIDLDDFKGINDTFGHVIGDRVLAGIAGRLCALLRPGDTITRHGGDEFTVLCEGIKNDAQAARVAERILETLERPIDIEGVEVTVSASIGVAVAASARELPDTLFANADAAMYRAKELGGGRVERFDANLRAKTRQRRGIRVALRRALERKELRLMYQPSISLSDGRVRAVEALIRWQHPERGLLNPDEIIPPAEETGLIVPIGMWVVEEACRQSVRWRSIYPDREVPHMSVNLSSRQLSQPGLLASLGDTLSRTGMDPRKLCLEITETVLMHDTNAALGELQALRGLGIELGIDDFGTGYSSLGYLKRFPFGWLKIDRSFVHGLGASPQDSAIVDGVIRLAHALDLTVIAEGVETASQVNELRRLQCDWAQGFYYARPQPAEEIDAMIESGTCW